MEHTGLNRGNLGENRVKVCWEVMSIIYFIKNNPNDSDNELRKKDLKQLTRGQYGSMIKWLMDLYLN